MATKKKVRRRGARVGKAVTARAAGVPGLGKKKTKKYKSSKQQKKISAKVLHSAKRGAATSPSKTKRILGMEKRLMSGREVGLGQRQPLTRSAKKTAAKKKLGKRMRAVLGMVPQYTTKKKKKKTAKKKTKAIRRYR